jgi:hypothetical protein
MKTAALLLLTALVVAGCRKHTDSAGPAAPRLAYISGVGDLQWQGGKVRSAGLARLSYTGDRLSGLRREERDTTRTVTGPDTVSWISYSLQEYSFRWQGGRIQAARLDTSYSFSSSSTGGVSVASSSGTEPLKYYYTGDRLDSIVYVETTHFDTRLVTDRYDGTGNIATRTILQYPNGTFNQGQLPLPTESLTTFTYDDHPNPWQLLFSAVGVVLPEMQGHNFSRNNPLSADIDLTPGVAGDAHKAVRWQYRYDAMGYPVSISADDGSAAVTVRYQ